jgi:serine/threonine protein kinase
VNETAFKNDNRQPFPKKMPDENETRVTGRCLHVSDRYEKVGRVGEGTYGVVYKARDRFNNKFVALKRCIPHHESSDGFPITTLREIASLRICCHSNIVSLDTVAVSKNGVFLVFEYCEHELASLIDSHFTIHKSSPFPQAACKTLLQQLLQALSFVHSHHVIHRDVKLSNLLYTNKGKLKLADFGLSRSYHTGAALTENVASLWYRPPELLLGSPRYSQAIDLWASGCVFAEFLKGYPAMNGKNPEEQLEKIVQVVGLPNLHDWPGLQEMPLVRDGAVQFPARSKRTLLDDFCHLSIHGLRLLSSLLLYNPDKRWTAHQALESSYFDEEPLPTRPCDMPQFPSKHLE